MIDAILFAAGCGLAAWFGALVSSIILARHVGDRIEALEDDLDHMACTLRGESSRVPRVTVDVEDVRSSDGSSYWQAQLDEAESAPERLARIVTEARQSDARTAAERARRIRERAAELIAQRGDR